MYDDPHPDDVDGISQLVHFNNLYVSRYLTCFSDDLFSRLHGAKVTKRTTALKGELKDASVENPPYRTARIDDLIWQYQHLPGRFFRETPCQATLYFIETGRGHIYVGSSRIKRIRRLAEKGARRLIDGVFDTIKGHADALAEERARQIGVSREDRRLRRPLEGLGEQAINDVAGLKVILEDHEQERLDAVLHSMEGCRVVEEERHQGRYNAVNRIVHYRPPKEAILQYPLDRRLLTVMQYRGLQAEDASREFAQFVRSGEDGVCLEIIASNYQEMLESEIGRSMHEDRIIEQRLRQRYRGHLAKNIEYLMRYLFAFPFSPRRHLDSLPIKVWNRYLPEYFDTVIADLFQISYFDF
jgi:hypothetical protein